VLPSGAPQNTTLDVQITGSGFDKTTAASFQLHGVVDSRVKVNSTRYVKNTQLVANVTIVADAAVDFYDAVVVTGSGKKGIGTELFEVQLIAETLAGATRSIDVNSAGDAVAVYPTGATCPAAVTPGVIALYHIDGTKVMLPLPASGLYCTAQAQAINNAGMVLGRLIGAGSTPATLALWTPVEGGYSIVELGAAPDGVRPSTARGLNLAGEVIGWTNTVPNVAKLYWWSSVDGWLSIPTPPGATMCNVYSGINDKGEIVGKCTVGGVGAPYYWASHIAAPIMMPTPPGVSDATPQDINNSGVAVGYSPALRWTPNGAGWLVEKLPDMGYGSSAVGIAEDGSVVGSMNTSSNISKGPLPVVWPQGAGYRFLPLPAGHWGETAAISSTAPGLIVVGGDRTRGAAVRWRPALSP
jgi:uncharacterized membrane protein